MCAFWSFKLNCLWKLIWTFFFFHFILLPLENTFPYPSTNIDHYRRISNHRSTFLTVFRNIFEGVVAPRRIKPHRILRLVIWSFYAVFMRLCKWVDHRWVSTFFQLLIKLIFYIQLSTMMWVKLSIYLRIKYQQIYLSILPLLNIYKVKKSLFLLKNGDFFLFQF